MYRNFDAAEMMTRWSVASAIYAGPGSDVLASVSGEPATISVMEAPDA